MLSFQKTIAVTENSYWTSQLTAQQGNLHENCKF